ncbi:hypothetical protein LSC12_003471 [Salmonella enterica]|uniref:Uncharacterized protein n=3 Tax=Salmonella enterica TaxID=28901 RepID=A0A616RQL8_SALNE|nr:hypothetical protein [Salmonella enterica]ECT9274590.1 hypothetical protein [Salmonella enterica subsp. enterica serovar Newport str. CFSAN000597]ECU0803400.1 hypothetical protein [Salmonella enterica subsp. enterica serovar Newport str. CFSAN001889]ECU4043313.1 hypothetical protein [Salmonella enterica subsp. enterica serovar Newport str. CFSAN000829]EDF3707767.1 hypothetical protein [Salmonella enterica subsp. enterica serovar Litchfield]EDQ4344172.1 hypothetical protein [Salmonella enter
MSAIPYPDWLPLSQKASKAMSFQVPFREDQPAVGSPIYEILTTDIATTWTLTWIFTRAQERAFQQWLLSPNYLNKGINWFTMLVDLGGSGLQQQELHFTSDGFPKQSSIDGGAVTWTGTVIARQLYNSDDDYDDIIVELPPPWYTFLDIIVTGYPDDRDPESLPRLP